MLIGFTGKAGSGKSTACKIIEDKIEDVVRINMKDALVAEMKKNLPRTLQTLVDELESRECEEWSVDRLFQEKPPLMRALLQEYGTEIRRGDDPDYWIKQWKYKVSYSTQNHVVVDDVRFLNEAQAVRDMGGVIVKIVRTDIMDTSSHSSETEMDSIVADYIISVEKGELDKLSKSLATICADLLLQETDK